MEGGKQGGRKKGEIITRSLSPLVLDISKHATLYEAALGVLYALTSHPPLHPLLLLPIFPDSDPSSVGGSGAGPTLSSLSQKLSTTVASYTKTAKYGGLFRRYLGPYSLSPNSCLYVCCVFCRLKAKSGEKSSISPRPPGRVSIPTTITATKREVSEGGREGGREGVGKWREIEKGQRESDQGRERESVCVCVCRVQSLKQI